MAAPPSSATLSAFPFLTVEEFRHGCCYFLDRIRKSETCNDLGWSSIRLVEQTNGPILKISRDIDQVDARHAKDAPEDVDSQESGFEALEDDPEALARTVNTYPGLRVEYDILLSPSYQVPVLYFTLRRGNNGGPVDRDTMYQYLVPEQYKTELTSVGVMGGISFDYHPVYGTPTFFVHPCNTADAIMHIAGWQNITPERYLLIWFGLVGNCVSLQVPYESFIKEVTQGPKVPLR